MNSLSLSFYDLIIILAVIQGFILASIFLLNKKFRKKSNVALAMSLLALCFVGIGNISRSIGLSEMYPIIIFLPIYHSVLLPLGYYYCAVYLIKPSYKFKLLDYIFIGYFILQLIFSLFLFLTYVSEPNSAWRLLESIFIIDNVKELISITLMLIVLTLVIRMVNDYHKQLLNNFSEITGKNLYWMRNVSIAIAVVVIGWAIFQVNFFMYHKFNWLLQFMWIGTCVFIYWLAYFIVLRRDIFIVSKFETDQPFTEPKTALSHKTEDHYQKLLRIIEEEKLYTNPSLNMDSLAKKMNLSNGYLSQIINQKENKNFYDFINTYRVNEVKAHLNDATFAHYSILGIGYEAGFNSKSTFNNVFKKMTGMTPSAYKKKLK